MTPLRLDAADIEAIENATLGAVVAEREETLLDDAGTAWRLPIDPGTVGRARSAVPLDHARAPHDADALIDAVERRYRTHGQPPRWRLAEVPALDGLRRALAARGYRAEQPTLTQVGRLADLRDAFRPPPGQAPVAVRIDTAPDAGWAQAFLGAGADAADAGHRLRVLGRSHGNRYASASLAGHTAAVGVIALAPRWAGLHGLRTEPAWRQRGLAGRLLHALAEAGLQAGLDRVFLQVEEDNASALSLYRRAGLRTAWRYRYWRGPD